jgi:hypothetical protein
VHDDRSGDEAERLEEVLGVPIPRQGEAVDAEAPLFGAPVHQGPHGHLADPQLPATRLRVEIGHHAEEAVVAQLLDPGHAVAHRDAVDGAHQHVVVVGVELAGELVLERRAAGGVTSPDRAPAAGLQLLHGGGGELAQPREVGLGGRAAALLGGRRHQPPCSCATFERIVLRPRLAAS